MSQFFNFVTLLTLLTTAITPQGMTVHLDLAQQLCKDQNATLVVPENRERLVKLHRSAIIAGVPLNYWTAGTHFRNQWRWPNGQMITGPWCTPFNDPITENVPQYYTVVLAHKGDRPCFELTHNILGKALIMCERPLKAN